MSEWYADEKPSGKPFVPDTPAAEMEDPLSMTEMQEGDITPAEISALSRAGYGRTDGDGRFFADEEKMSGGAARAALPKPNNVSMRLPASECAPVECAWGSVQSRIVDHRGQGSMHMRGNLKAFNKPSPAYSVAHDNGGAHFTA